jgi:hypothetical protein
MNDQPTTPASGTAAGLSVATGSAFRVKMLQLWIIPLTGRREWGGVWETIGVRGLSDEKNESWELRRVMACDDNQPLRETRRLPRWLLLEHCRCVKLQTISEPNTRISPIEK